MLVNISLKQDLVPMARPKVHGAAITRHDDIWLSNPTANRSYRHMPREDGGHFVSFASIIQLNSGSDRKHTKASRDGMKPSLPVWKTCGVATINGRRRTSCC